LDQEKIIEEVKAKQRNTLWPETMTSGRAVSEFLWRGNPDATIFQRIGAWIFGLFFILISLANADTAYEDHSWLGAVFSIICFLIGGKIFLNGFRRHTAAKNKT
jgi:hypothetical protein